MSQHQTARYFKIFYSNSDFQKQFQEVNIELSFDEDDFEKSLKECLDTIITFTKLTKLIIKLSPEVEESDEIFDFNNLFVKINNTIEDFLPDVSVTIIVSDENMDDLIDSGSIQEQCQQTFGENVEILFNNEKLFEHKK